MNGFEQIKSFYSWVFNNPDKVKPTHISLYLFLLNQNNRSMWVEWFKCPYDLAMQGSCIGSKSTYYKCLKELQEYGLINYKEGLNNYKAPLINLICLYNSVPLTEQVTVPLTEQVTVPLTEPLSVLLTEHIYKLITNNYKLINDNKEKITSFVESLKEKKCKFSFFNSLIDLGVEKQLVNDWLAVRKNKNLTNTETAFKNLEKEFEKCGKPIPVIIEKCVTESWGGFKASWDWKDGQPKNSETIVAGRQTMETIKKNLDASNLYVPGLEN